MYRTGPYLQLSISMKITVYTYKFPFTDSFQTGVKIFNCREGVFIKLKKDGIAALGEAAPLPGFSKETKQEVLAQLQAYAPEIKSHFEGSLSLADTHRFLQSHASFPHSLQVGLFTLAVTFLAQQKNISLPRLLFQTCSKPVSVNAVIDTKAETRMKKISQAVRRGFQTIKLKTGENWTEFINSIETVRQLYPGLSIRIDANQSWPFEQAAAFLPQLEPYNIEYCEEPLANPRSESLQKLSKISPVPLALDESIFHSLKLDQAFELAPVIIVKPMVWGLAALRNEIREEALKHHTKLIFTTSLESGIGRLLTAALAAGLGDANTAHGLATGNLLAKDVWRDDAFIKKGQFQLPGVGKLQQLMNVKLSGLANEEFSI
jgi:O-succinylbenzoate synthase